jgi:hypothetical protein
MRSGRYRTITLEFPEKSDGLHGFLAKYADFTVREQPGGTPESRARQSHKMAQKLQPQKAQKSQKISTGLLRFYCGCSSGSSERSIYGARSLVGPPVARSSDPGVARQRDYVAQVSC